MVNLVHPCTNIGGVAQMVERSLSMREVPGSIPGASTIFYPSFHMLAGKLSIAKLLWGAQAAVLFSDRKRVCIVRESNPGRPRGRRAFYH